MQHIEAMEASKKEEIEELMKQIKLTEKQKDIIRKEYQKKKLTTDSKQEIEQLKTKLKKGGKKVPSYQISQFIRILRKEDFGIKGKNIPISLAPPYVTNMLHDEFEKSNVCEKERAQEIGEMFNIPFNKILNWFRCEKNREEKKQQKTTNGTKDQDSSRYEDRFSTPADQLDQSRGPEFDEIPGDLQSPEVSRRDVQELSSQPWRLPAAKRTLVRQAYALDMDADDLSKWLPVGTIAEHFRDEEFEYQDLDINQTDSPTEQQSISGPSRKQEIAETQQRIIDFNEFFVDSEPESENSDREERHYVELEQPIDDPSILHEVEGEVINDVPVEAPDRPEREEPHPVEFEPPTDDDLSALQGTEANNKITEDQKKKLKKYFSKCGPHSTKFNNETDSLNLSKEERKKLVEEFDKERNNCKSVAKKSRSQKPMKVKILNPLITTSVELMATNSSGISSPPQRIPTENLVQSARRSRFAETEENQMMEAEVEDKSANTYTHLNQDFEAPGHFEQSIEAIGVNSDDNSVPLPLEIPEQPMEKSPNQSSQINDDPLEAQNRPEREEPHPVELEQPIDEPRIRHEIEDEVINDGPLEANRPEREESPEIRFMGTDAYTGPAPRPAPVIPESQRKPRLVPESILTRIPDGATEEWELWTREQVLQWSSLFLDTEGQQFYMKKKNFTGLSMAEFLDKKDWDDFDSRSPINGIYISLRANLNRIINHCNGWTHDD